MQAEVLNGTKGLKMTQRHVVEVRQTLTSDVTTGQADSLSGLPQLSASPLRFAVSLTNPQGTEVFRKQFATQPDADAFAAATAELCPDYKVAWVDRMEGLAWERVGSWVSVTASPASEKVTQS
ncbi:MAG: hypothetical protein QOG21_251 [Actinomycetota bacterium]|nr:hypothetical protein [Actinomycetota bacterium]